MTIESFERHRRAQETLTSAVPGSPRAVYRAYLHKPERQGRLYRIDPIGISQWRCEVHIGAQIHRTVIAPTRTHMVARRKEYEREVADLILDGWILDDVQHGQHL